MKRRVRSRGALAAVVSRPPSFTPSSFSFTPGVRPQPVSPLGRDAPLELLGVSGLGDRVFLADVAVDEQLLDRAVERLHAQRTAGLDDVGDFEDAVLADAVPHG